MPLFGSSSAGLWSGYIGIDDVSALAHPADVPAPAESTHYAALYPELYRLLGRRVRKDEQRVTPQGWAVLHHLELAGPLMVQEMTVHLGRAQSVISEMVATLERAGMLQRLKDPRDRRRTLVWLTEGGLGFLKRQREVLDPERLGRAMARLSGEERELLLRGTQALVRAAELERRQELAAEKEARTPETRTHPRHLAGNSER